MNELRQMICNKPTGMVKKSAVIRHNIYQNYCASSRILPKAAELRDPCVGSSPRAINRGELLLDMSEKERHLQHAWHTLLFKTWDAMCL